MTVHAPHSSLPLSPRDLRRNFILGVINGAVFNISEVFMDPEMVFTWFLAQLGASNFLIGLVLPIRQTGWFIPQIFASGYVQRQPRKLPFYKAVGVFRSCTLLGLVLGVLFIPAESPWLLVIFFACLIAYSLGSGLAGLVFMAMLQRVIPPRRRGSFFAQRMFWGGLLALGASAAVGVLLDQPDNVPVIRSLHFPFNFALMFGISFVAFVLTLMTWAMIEEPPEDVSPERVHWRVQIKRGAKILRENVPYRTFVMVRLCLMLAQLAMPFYIVYAKDVLHVPARMAGVYLTARTASSIVSNLLWGRISDRQGNRRLIRITNCVGLAIPLLSLSIGALGGLMPSLLPWLSYIFTLVFIASGAYGMGSAIANMNYLLDIAPPQQRALYVGFSNTLFGLAVLASSLGGVIVDWAGFAPVMIVAACLYTLAIALSFAMIEPRT